MVEKFNMEAAEFVVDYLEERGFNASVYKNYSGRGMYGRTCVGIVTNTNGVLVGEAIGEYNRGCLSDDEDVVSAPERSDNMGLDMIYY